jgi:hypothetical protein
MCSLQLDGGARCAFSLVLCLSLWTLHCLSYYFFCIGKLFLHAYSLMTDTYLIWKLISLINFIYITFVCKGKTGQLTCVHSSLMEGLVVLFRRFSVSSCGHCIVFHIIAFVSANFSYTHIPSSRC